MRTTFSYDHYYLQNEIEEHIRLLAERYPNLVDWESLLETPDGHRILAVTLTNKATGAAKDKPAFHIDGNTHAGEVTGMMAAMHTMDCLATNYGADERVTFILDRMAVYIVPCVSPDGAETYLTTGYKLRSVNRPYYEQTGGLQQEDIDGDGAIRMMRVRNPYGAWKEDSEHEGCMLRRGPADTEGTFWDIYTEGMIDGAFDGVEPKVQKEKFGRDFNRNYPYGWFPEGRQPGAGEYPLRHPETRALAEWIIAHPNIGSVATNHTSGGMLLMVPGTYSEKQAPAEDMKLLNAIGAMGTATMGYTHVNLFDTFITDKDHCDSGAFDDFCYETQGIYAMTLELWDLDSRCGIKHFWENKPWDDLDAENFAKRLAWVRENAPEMYLPWREFDHPQLGKVEIGGFNFKFTVQNPPAHLLLQECEKATAFMLQWAQAMPRLVIDSVTVTDLGGDLCRVEAVVSNAGYLPTYLSQKAKALKVAKGVKVAIDVPADKILSGDAVAEIGDLSSYGLTRTGGRFYGNITTTEQKGISKKVSWILKGKPDSVTVTASTPKGGTVVKTVRA